MRKLLYILVLLPILAVGQISEEYEIVKVEDFSVSIYARVGIHIIVPTNITSDLLKAAMKHAVQSTRKVNPEIDEIVVYAYDRMEDVDHGYTFGKVEWAPNGQWGSTTAEIARSNNRSSYQYKFDIKGKVGNIKNLDVPTKREYEIYDYWDSLIYGNLDLSGEEVDRIVAERFNITVEEVSKICIKVVLFKMK